MINKTVIYIYISFNQKYNQDLQKPFRECFHWTRFITFKIIYLKHVAENSKNVCGMQYMFFMLFIGFILFMKPNS